MIRTVWKFQVAQDTCNDVHIFNVVLNQLEFHHTHNMDHAAAIPKYVYNLG